MGDIERLTVRLDSDAVAVLQKLVDDGEYSSMSDAVANTVYEMIGSRFTPKEISRIVTETRKKDVDIDVLLSDGDSPELKEIVSKAVAEYVKSKMNPEE